MTDYDSNTEEPWGLFDGRCQACDLFCRVNDMSLCEDCAGKLERDMIRERKWEYSVSAFALPPEAYEELRRGVIAEYGESLELIAPRKGSRKKKPPRRAGNRGRGKKG